jgi:PAS domain S-box-containing protein
MAPPEVTTLQSRDTLLLESLDEPIVATRLDGTIVAWSRGAELLYGWSRAEAVGEKVHELLHTISLTSTQQIRAALLGPEARWCGELQRARKDGIRITVSSRQQLITQLPGAEIVIARDRDISARTRTVDTTHQQEEDRRYLEMRERFQFSTDAAQIGYWFCDLPFDKLIWDARVKEHFWFPPDAEVDIAMFYQHLHPDDHERTSAAMQESIANHTRYDIEYRTLSPEGQVRWVRAIGRTGYDSVGTPIRFDGITHDITSIKRSEEALRKSEKLAVVGRLAASIAHEINNPLEAVVSLIYVARSMATNDELRGYLDTAEQELYRVAHIVSQSLRFHRQSTAASQVRISSLMDSALTLYRGRLKHSTVEITTKYRDTQPLICLSSELRQVFANLIGNAFEATRTGRIELRAHPATDPRTGAPGIRAIIADTGHGIDSKTREHLFEAFVTTKGEFGTGLGLWVSAEILKRHHATIQVKSSTAPGHSGTIFSIFFPLIGPDPIQQSRSDAPLPQLST